MRARRSRLRQESEGRVLRSRVVRDYRDLAGGTLSRSSSNKRKRHSGSKTTYTRASATTSAEVNHLTSDEQVRAQPDVIQPNEKLVMPLDGHDLKRIIQRIERDRDLCFKMRWYVARHVRKQFQSGVAPSLQNFQIRIRQALWERNAFKEERRQCGLEERVVFVPVLKTRPYNRLDFEAMRAQQGFRKDDPDWEFDKWSQVLQRAYDKYGWSSVVGEDDVDAILAKAGADLTLFDRASRQPDDAIPTNNDTVEDAADDVFGADLDADVDGHIDTDNAVNADDAADTVDTLDTVDVVDTTDAMDSADTTGAIGAGDAADADVTNDTEHLPAQEAPNDQANEESPNEEVGDGASEEEFDLATREDHWFDVTRDISPVDMALSFDQGLTRQPSYEEGDTDDEDDDHPRKRRRLLAELPFAGEELLAPEAPHLNLLRRKVRELKEEKVLLHELQNLRDEVFRARKSVLS